MDRETKDLFASKATWAALFGLASFLLLKFNVDIGPVEEWVEVVTPAVGVALFIWSRFDQPNPKPIGSVLGFKVKNRQVEIIERRRAPRPAPQHVAADVPPKDFNDASNPL